MGCCLPISRSSTEGSPGAAAAVDWTNSSVASRAAPAALTLRLLEEVVISCLLNAYLAAYVALALVALAVADQSTYGSCAGLQKLNGWTQQLTAMLSILVRCRLQECGSLDASRSKSGLPSHSFNCCQPGLNLARGSARQAHFTVFVLRHLTNHGILGFPDEHQHVAAVKGTNSRLCCSDNQQQQQHPPFAANCDSS